MGEGLLAAAGTSPPSPGLLSSLLGLEVQGFDETSAHQRWSEPPLLTLGLPSAWTPCRLWVPLGGGISPWCAELRE